MSEAESWFRVLLRSIWTDWWLLLSLRTLYIKTEATVSSSWRGGNSRAVTKVIKFTIPHTNPSCFCSNTGREKKKCLCDRLCCRLQLYIGQIWGPSNTIVKCCCPHLVKYIAQHIVVSFNVTGKHHFVSKHFSKNIWTVDKLHRKKKNVFMKAAVSGREWNKWWAVKPKPWERQMTGETSPCQRQPTLLWPTDLSDGWICAGTVRDQGPGPLGDWGGADQSGPKPYIQKHIPKNFLKKL